MKSNLFSANLFTLFLFVLTFESCSSEQNLKRLEVNLIPSISSSNMRAVDLKEDGSGRFSEKDEIRLLMTDGKNPISSILYTINKPLFWDELTIHPQTQSVTFAGIYPYVEIVSFEKFIFNIQTAENKDLLIAEPIHVPIKSTNAQHLVFRHAMHKVEVNYTISSDALLDNAQISTTLRNIAPEAIINVMKGTNEGVTEKRTDITAKGQKVTFLIPPQNAEGITLEVKIKAEGELQERTYTYPFPKNIEGKEEPLKKFEENSVIRLNVKVTRMAILLESATISPWNSQGEIKDEIII